MQLIVSCLHLLQDRPDKQLRDDRAPNNIQHCLRRISLYDNMIIRPVFRVIEKRF